MTIWTAFNRAYAESWRFVVALPLIALAVVGFEGLQHLVEWRIGMYGDVQAARATADHPARMIAGYAKVAWLLVIQFWAARFMVGHSVRRALAPPPVALRAFAGVLLFNLALSVLTLQLPGLLQAAGLTRPLAAYASLAFMVVTTPLGVALTPWVVGAALSDPRATPLFALRRARSGLVVWALVVMLMTSLPLMVAHYVLALGAIGRPATQAIPMLAFDAVLVGFLGVVLAASQVVIGEKMAQRAGETLRLD